MAANSLFFACAMLLIILSTTPNTMAAPTCGQVATQMTSCISYMTGVGALPATCCQGVRNLNLVAKTKPDRQAVCGCVKTIAGSIPGIKPNLFATIPSKCGVNLPYKISPTMDCSKYFEMAKR